MSAWVIVGNFLEIAILLKKWIRNSEEELVPQDSRWPGWNHLKSRDTVVTEWLTSCGLDPSSLPESPWSCPNDKCRMSLYLDEIYRQHGKVGKLTDHKMGCGLPPSLPRPLSPNTTPLRVLICSQSSLSLQHEIIWNQVFKESRRWKLRRKIYFNWQYAQVGLGAFDSWLLNEETKCRRSKKFNTFDFFKRDQIALCYLLYLYKSFTEDKFPTESLKNIVSYNTTTRFHN